MIGAEMMSMTSDLLDGLSSEQLQKVSVGIHWARVFGLLNDNNGTLARTLVMSIIFEEAAKNARAPNGKAGPSPEEGS